jgi:parvulin-like peptidyl-prolyl isomerase
MLLSALFALRALAADPAPADPVVARVQSVEIHASEFQAAAKKAKPADGKALSAEERRAVLDGLVDEKLIWLEAKKSETTLANPVVQKALVKAYLTDVVYQSVAEPTEAELRAFFDANPAPYVSPAAVRGSRILVRVGGKVDAAAARAKADTLRASVVANPRATFAAVAKKSSQDENRNDGGDLGLVVRSDKKLDPTVVKTLFSTRPGTVSAVFMTREGANIVWVVRKREPAAKTFEQAQPDVLKRWKAAKMVEARTASVARLEKASRVKVDEAALAAVVLPVARTRPAAAGATAKPGGKGAAPAAPAEPEEVEPEGDEDDE